MKLLIDDLNTCDENPAPDTVPEDKDKLIQTLVFLLAHELHMREDYAHREFSGCSWYKDELADISRRMDFLRKIPQQPVA